MNSVQQSSILKNFQSELVESCQLLTDQAIENMGANEVQRLQTVARIFSNAYVELATLNFPGQDLKAKPWCQVGSQSKNQAAVDAIAQTILRCGFSRALRDQFVGLMSKGIFESHVETPSDMREYGVKLDPFLVPDLRTAEEKDYDQALVNSNY